MSLPGGGPSPASLPVHATVAGTYQHVARNLRVVAYLAALPAALRLAAELFSHLALASPPSAWAQIAMLLLTTMLMAIFSVSWQRYTLLGEINRQHAMQFVFDRREGLFFVCSLLLMTPALVAVTSVLAAPDSNSLLPPILMGLAVFLFVRLSMLLPAISVDGEPGVKQAWRLTQGQFWRLFAVLLLVTVPPELAATLVLVLLASDQIVVVVVGHAIAVALQFLITAIVMTALALCYRWLAGPPGAVVVQGPSARTGTGN